MNDNHPRLRAIRSFVRREGRFTDAQKKAFEELWPRYGVTPDESPFDFTSLFGNHNPVILEIGFGNGTSLAQMAADDTKHNYLGIEVHRPGVGRLMNRLRDEQINNVRLACHDAVEILKQNIPEQSLAGIQIFFPDPWPKKKHHKRRLIQTPLVELLRDRLSPGGFLHLATDWEDYALHMMEVISAVSGLQNRAGEGRYSPRPGRRPVTKYENRGQNLGHGVWDLLFVRDNSVPGPKTPAPS